MRVSAVFAFSVIASLAQAWTIPANTEDGFYSVSTTKDGSTVHEKISGPLEVELAESKRELSNEVSTLEERFPASVYCGCGFTLDPGNCDAAVADLKNQLTSSGNTIGPHLSFYSIRGSVVAFVCNYSNANKHVNAGDVAQRLAYVTSNCGRYIAGAAQFGVDIAAAHIGYQRYKSGDDFCANADSSSANHC